MLRFFGPDEIGTPISDLAGLADPRALHFIRHGAATIANARTPMGLLDTGEVTLPVSIHDCSTDVGDSWVVSPSSLFATSVDRELKRLNGGTGITIIRALVALHRLILQLGAIDRIVEINNWVTATNPLPRCLQSGLVATCKAELARRFPRHAIAWRSLTLELNADLIRELSATGFICIPFRQVWLFDTRNGLQSDCFGKRDSVQDAKLLKRSEYSVEHGKTLDAADFDRAAYLYESLYIDKYSDINPRCGALWLKAGMEGGWLEVRVLRHPTGRIDGVVAFMEGANGLCAPFLGYDQTLDRRLGLYRMLTRIVLEEGALRRVWVNLSSGVATFKQFRGGQCALDYLCIYEAHLSCQRRAVWNYLSQVQHRIAVPLMRRWGI